ncbi:MAG: ATP-binding protein [Elusimicrobia bacterium RIFOXYD2_FULL_34_15]|nr:MAG: ATP-binding protein [Elusimicrobia bacterium RIFOXYD2_FULL_34_15]HAM38288.1 ATP-binding protein [Elusimicrobiota bacterium]
MEQLTREQEIDTQILRIKEKMSKIAYSIIVMSGKGGVGKTSVAVNLAYALSLKGKRTGILDIDIHGPNIAKMLGIEKELLRSSESGIIPVEVKENLKAISLALTGNNPDQPIIWRGPMKAGVIRQFLSEVEWGELDYLIIDAPPGTGDEPLSAIQYISNVSGAVIVTTPQDVAILDSRKSVMFAQELKIPVIGIIENMSGFICPYCHKETDIFKKGGGEKAANELDVPFLGSIPFEKQFVECGDEGKPFVSLAETKESIKKFIDIVDKIEKFVKN